MQGFRVIPETNDSLLTVVWIIIWPLWRFEHTLLSIVACPDQSTIFWVGPFTTARNKTDQDTALTEIGVLRLLRLVIITIRITA